MLRPPVNGASNVVLARLVSLDVASRADSPAMPEGHTVHRLARSLRDTLGSAPVTATSPQGRFEAGARLLDGEAIARSEAWGKYLFVSFGASVLHVHLGLIGKFRDRGAPP